MSGPKRLFDEAEVLEYANAAYAQAIEAAAKVVEPISLLGAAVVRGLLQKGPESLPESSEAGNG